MWKPGEVGRVIQVALGQLGTPYEHGGKDPETGNWVVRGKPSINEKSPKGFDCSGLSRWTIGQGVKSDGGTIILCHGAQEQLAMLKPVVGYPKPLDLGFADMDGKLDDPRPIDHVIIRLDDRTVIEARGPQKNRDYGKVITRPVAVWEHWPGFLGWWRVPGIYDDENLIKVAVG